MRLVNVDALYEKAVKLEAEAMKMCSMMAERKFIDKWKMWSAILNERISFTYDLVDAPTVDAIPLSEFAHELDLICLKLQRADISDEHRKELEAEKKYMVGWINNWLYNSGVGFNGGVFHGVTAEEIIKRCGE